MDSNKTILIMAGGTGGHVFPALAIAKSLIEKGYYIEWLGTSAGIEAEIIPNENIKLNIISIKGLRGNGLFGIVTSPIKILKAIGEARKIIKALKPVAVLGLGGYATGPGGVAAFSMGIPLLIHEQNAFAGMTNRLLAKISRYRMQAFPGAIKNATVTGNPVRKEIIDCDRTQRSQIDQLRVLVVGGSLGAVALNEAVLNAMSLMQPSQRPSLTHQAGKRNFTDLNQKYLDKNIDANVCAFIEDMAEAYKSHDLIICRSGALTVSEVAAVGIPAIFIPFPFAVDDHQTENAKYLESSGAALIKQQSELSPEWLISQWNRFTENPSILQNMSVKAKDVGILDATERVVTIIEEASIG